MRQTKRPLPVAVLGAGCRKAACYVLHAYGQRLIVSVVVGVTVCQPRPAALSSSTVMDALVFEEEVVAAAAPPADDPWGS